MYVGSKSNTILGYIIYRTQISGNGAMTSQKQQTYDKIPEFFKTWVKTKHLYD